MSELITVLGRTLIQSAPTPPTPAAITYSITEIDAPALKTRGEGKQILLSDIKLHCECLGDYAVGQKFKGSGDASIVANTQRVKCEGKLMLLKGDKVTITCKGTITDTSSGTTSPGTASVTVTITDPNQNSIFSTKT